MDSWFDSPQLENYDALMEALQLCPTSLLSLVRNGLKRYVDKIDVVGEKIGLSCAARLERCRPFDNRANDVSDLILKRQTEQKAQEALSEETLVSVSSLGGRRDSGVVSDITR